MSDSVGRRPGSNLLRLEAQHRDLSRASSLCLVPHFDGAILSLGWKEALWDKFFMAAPRRQRRSVERYKIVKRA